jgi:dephospho-CoA kinase
VNDGTIVVDDMRAHPHLLPTCQFVAGVGASQGDDDAAADVWLEDVASLDALWRDRLVPFAANLAAGVRAHRRRRAVLVEPDPTWSVQAQRLIARLRAAVADQVHRIDHIGSTSVPGLAAKQLVDIQIVVADFATASRVADAASAAGFVRVAGPLWCVDQFGVRHDEEVVVDADPGRPVNVNIRPIAAPIWRETLLFRDWLRAEPAARNEYEAMKRELAARPDSNVDEYSVDKYPWISAATARAEKWAARVGYTP